MKYMVVVLLGLTFFCLGSVGFAAQEKDHEIVTDEQETIVIGALEKIRILPADIIYDARIDTGATTTSIHAANIDIFERDGKKWVKFDLEGKDKTETVEMKIKEFKNIKRHGAPDQIRAVVTIHLVLGNISQMVDVTLNDRSKFTYPGLIGRNFLKPNNILVDVSKEYTVKPAKE